MRYEESVRLCASDGYTLHARRWLPGAPRGAVVYLHGIESHGAWFTASAQRIAAAGFVVLLPDRRGSGRNDVERGHTPSASRLLADVLEHVDEAAALARGKPAHLLGVSWGGKLALAAALHAPGRVASLTLVTPGLFPRIGLPFARKLRVALALAVRPKARFETPLTDPALFTSTERWRRFIADDPHKLTEVTASFLFASVRLDRLVRQAVRRPPACPVTAFLAGRDRIIDTARTRHFIHSLGAPTPAAKRKVIEFPDADHTLEFDDDPEPYFAALADAIPCGSPRLGGSSA